MARTKKEKMVYSSVSLPVPLLNKVKETIQGTGYSSVGSFVEDLVRTALTLKKEETFVAASEAELPRISRSARDGTKLSEETAKRLKERLKSLGYLG